MKASIKQIGFVKLLANCDKDVKMVIRLLKDTNSLTFEEADSYIKAHTRKVESGNKIY